MGELITSFEHTYDLVLLDCPPVLGAVDTILAASFCSGVVMLGWINRVTRTDFMKAIDMLRSINVIGIVASGTDSKNSYIPYTEVRAQASSDVPALVSN
jgi:Mrp family chromosome partitioning ATPase